MASRTCSKCGVAKPSTAEHFRPERRFAVGFQAACRDCERAARRAARAADPGADRRYYEANKARLLPKMAAKRRARYAADPAFRAQKAAYAAANRDKKRRWQRAFYARWRERERERLRKYYEDHPARRVAAAAKREAWRRANREKARSYVRNRRAKLLASAGQHSGADIEALLAAQAGCCWWCGQSFGGDGHEVDHRIPVARGGGNGPANLVLACGPCNRRKSTKMPWHLVEGRLL